jgi:trehalose utilization protein
MAVRVTVWNEFFHENTEESIAAIYPGGIHMAIADFLKKDEDIIVRTATLQEPARPYRGCASSYGCADLVGPCQACRSC